MLDYTNSCEQNVDPKGQLVLTSTVSKSDSKSIIDLALCE